MTRRPRSLAVLVLVLVAAVTVGYEDEILFVPSGEAIGIVGDGPEPRRGRLDFLHPARRGALMAAA